MAKDANILVENGEYLDLSKELAQRLSEQRIGPEVNDKNGLGEEKRDHCSQSYD